MKNAKFVLMAVVMLAALSSPLFAQALGIDLNTVPPIKEYDFLPPEQFDAATKLVREEAPYNDERLSYELRLPKGWTGNVQAPPVGQESGAKLLSDTVLVTLGRYIAPPKNFERSYITVEAQELGYEISAQNWFVNFMLGNGFSLAALSERSPREIESLYVQVINDITYMVRVRVLINGPRLVMVRYYLPQVNIEDERIEQAQVTRSFLLGNNEFEPIEKYLDYGFLDQSYFSYPASWSLKEKSILSIERMYALLYQERKDGKESVLDGHIRINVISKLLKTTLPQEIEIFRDELNVPGYRLGTLIEDLNYKYDPSIKIGKSQMYKLIPADAPRMKDYEFAVAAMEGENYYYITSLITPSREQDFYMWARNMEAFRIVNESVRRGNAGLQPDLSDPYYDYLKQTK